MQMTHKQKEAWEELKAPVNETVTSQWYFKKGYEAGQASVTLPEDERIKFAAQKDSASLRNDNKEKYCTNKDFAEARTNAFIRGAKFVVSYVEKLIDPTDKQGEKV